MNLNSIDILSLIGRTQELFESDISHYEKRLSKIVSSSKFLVLGAAGSIGQSVTKEIFKRNPLKLHVVDISENNLVELVRDIRSSYGYISGDFRSFALDIGSLEYDYFFESDGVYDYVLNLSALKHVRSEEDHFTLMRMIDVNILNTNKTISQSIKKGVSKYFCVSTDKAANPVNMMGATKLIMEKLLFSRGNEIKISTARFANVAFSDGSLLHGFNQRILKNQPLVAPSDVKRYFVTPKESGELCLMSCIFGESADIFFPKLSDKLHLITFSEIAKKYLIQIGFEPYVCMDEDDARNSAKQLSISGKWPCLFSTSDTTGEKPFEEFYTSDEITDMSSFENIGIVKNKHKLDNKLISQFQDEIFKMRKQKNWTKKQILELFQTLIPNFIHEETGKFLDSKM